jgi:hypothetical protein
MGAASHRLNVNQARRQPVAPFRFVQPARPVRVMGRLPRLPLLLCFSPGPCDPRDPPPETEDASCQSLQPTCCQTSTRHAPTHSRADNLRCRVPPRRAPPSAMTPKRHFVRRGSALALAVAETTHQPRVATRFDAARRSCSRRNTSPGGPRSGASHGERHFPPRLHAVNLKLLMSPVTPAAVTSRELVWPRAPRTASLSRVNARGTAGP